MRILFQEWQRLAFLQPIFIRAKYCHHRHSTAGLKTG
jgi:hypothetical protein